jgi:hypothetical protein
MSERTTIGSTPSPRRARRAGWIAAATVAGLLLATPVLAHGGAMGAAPTRPMAGMRPGGWMHPEGGPAGGGTPFGGAQRFGGMGYENMGFGGMGFGGMRFGHAGAGAGTSGMLQRLPLGTEVSVALYGADPVEGGEATATLAATVGETSEAAFAQELASAAEDAAFLVVEIGPRVRRVDLSDATARAPLGMLGRMGGPLEFGDTIEVALYAAADDATPSTTLAFTYGEDSEAAFRAELAEAAADAAVAEVTLPAQTRTLDLSARPFAGTPDGSGYGPGYGPGMRMPGRGR